MLDHHSEPAMSGYVLDMAGRRLRVRVSRPIPFGAPVKVEAPEMLLLGEAHQCEPVEGAFEAGLMLSQVLSSLSDLLALNRALLGENYREPLAPSQA
jgi:hypothetical protein